MRECPILMSGPMVRAANRFVYEGADIGEMKKEAVQVGAMAMRFLAGLDEYERQRSKMKDPDGDRGAMTNPIPRDTAWPA